MANYKLGPVIGKIGGADVQKIPFNFTTPSQGTHTLYTIEVPEGETWLIAFSGHLAPGNDDARFSPQLVLGDMITSRSRAPDLTMGIAGEFEAGPVIAAIQENSSNYGSVFVGNVWIVPLP